MIKPVEHIRVLLSEAEITALLTLLDNEEVGFINLGPNGGHWSWLLSVGEKLEKAMSRPRDMESLEGRGEMKFKNYRFNREEVDLLNNVLEDDVDYGNMKGWREVVIHDILRELNRSINDERRYEG